MRPPRIPELLFAAVLVWLFATGQGWSVLLADGDTGWHIRNGEQIIDSRGVPHRDSFSFGSEDHPWFSWEWLADVIFAALFRAGGLKALTLFCGVAIAASVSVLFRHMLWRSVGVCIALPLTLLTVGASSIHYLARPHAVALLIFAVVMWMLDRERAAPSLARWCLPVVFMVWANFHGSFLAGLAMLGLWFAEGAYKLWRTPDCRTWKALSGPTILLTSTCTATLCNPYGWHLHAHALEYLRSAWIQATIEEFQSPRFRSENMFQYEILLMAGIAALPWLLRRREIYPLGVVILWAHESLASVRHVPLYCLAAAPFVASWLQQCWNLELRRRSPGSLLATFDSINLTWKAWASGFTAWPVVLCIVVGVNSWASRESVAFPANKFPITVVERNLARLGAFPSPPQRIFSSDQWSDYLIFRVYPAVRIFFDGRSDFFGPWRGKEYLRLMAGQSGSGALLDRENVDLALLPTEWALSGILRNDPHWLVLDMDGQAVLFKRNSSKISRRPNQENLGGR